MLQGALIAVAARAKEAKAAVGSAVGEIRDALDNPNYHDDEDEEAWSDEEGDSGVADESTAPPPGVHVGATAGNGAAPAPAGGALAALRARLAAERERKKASDGMEANAGVPFAKPEVSQQAVPVLPTPPQPTPGRPSVPFVPPPYPVEIKPVRSETKPPERTPGDAQTTSSQSPRRESSSLTASRSESSSSHVAGDDSKLASQLTDARGIIVELQRSHDYASTKHAEQLKLSEQNTQLALRDLSIQKFETEKKEKELLKMRRHLLEMEAEDDAKEDTLREREMALSQQAEASISTAVATSFATAKAAERDCEILRVALAAKDLELANLQKALAHFDDERDESTRLVVEAVLLRENNARIAAELTAERAVVAAASEKVCAAERKCVQLEKHAAAADAAAQKSVSEASRARRALAEHATRAVTMASDSSEQIDRRVVGKLLVTYFERERSVDVLELMARVLGLGEEDKTKIGVGPLATRHRKGVLGAVAAAPGRLVYGALGLAGTVAKVPFAVAETYKPESDTSTVADQWVDFLLQQMDAEDGESG